VGNLSEKLIQVPRLSLDITLRLIVRKTIWWRYD